MDAYHEFTPGVVIARNMDLRRKDGKDTILVSAMEGWDFSGSDLRGVDISSASMDETTILTGTNLDGIRLNATTHWEDGPSFDDAKFDHVEIRIDMAWKSDKAHHETFLKLFPGAKQGQTMTFSRAEFLKMSEWFGFKSRELEAEPESSEK
jgi:uncharacterized protein YjbI with pentapeptide repeats